MPVEADRNLEVGDVLVRNWPLVALRGVAAVLFGLITMFQPGIGLAALVLLFGVYALADGILGVVLVIMHRNGERHWAAMLIASILSIGAGVLTFLFPGITALALLFVIAAWAVVMGGAEIVTAIRLRKVITGEWLLILAGVLSVAFGVLLALFPWPGALAVVLWIGAYAFVSGILLIVLAFKLRSWARTHPHAVATPRTA
jgi:uncharacterized membrane protein HdeD (DUF308 family)